MPPRVSLIRRYAFSPARAFSAKAVERSHPDLFRVPSLPVFGSLLLPFYTKTPPVDLKRITQYWRALHADKGSFYSVGIPGFGQGLHGTVYMIRDPNEMLKVIKQEGTYPSGFIQTMWPFVEWMKTRSYSTVGFFRRDEEWRRIRMAMQKDLLAPQSAREYLPAILKGAAIASAKAADLKEDDDVLRYLNFCAMDMFTGVLFGGDDGASPEDTLRFGAAAVNGLRDSLRCMREPKEMIAHLVGYKTALVKQCFANFDVVDEVARKRLYKFLERIESRSISEQDKNSYFYKFMVRQPDSNVTQDEAIEICVLLMLAAVDTTAGMTAWNLVQLAIHPKIQQDLFEQIRQAVQKDGGLTPRVFERSDVPLLKAFARETHRCTPSNPFDISKEVSSPTEVHGVTLPAGSVVALSRMDVEMSEDFIKDPMTFDPTRWLPEAEEARKGTPAAIIDHPFFAGPFSQGARRCPGSRVANLEVQAMLARFLLDWKIEGPSGVHWNDIPSVLATGVVPEFPNAFKFVPRST